MTVSGSSTRNLCHQDILTIKHFIQNSFKHCGKLILHSLQCCTTTTHHVTRQSPSMNCWQKKDSCGSSAPYSSDVSPCNFFFFLWLENHLKGRHFVTLDNIRKSVTDELKGIPTEAFQPATINDNNASVAVQQPKGTTLKGITLICKKKKILSQNEISLLTFLAQLVSLLNCRKRTEF